MDQLLGLWPVPEGHAYAPYARMAREWRASHMETLAASVGGGVVGPGPALIVANAAIQLASSRWLSDLGIQTGDPATMLAASRLANDARQSILAAHEGCAREAAARPKDHEAHARALIAAFGVKRETPK